MMKAFIYGQKWKAEDKLHVTRLFDKLESDNIEYALYSEYARQVDFKEKTFKTIGDNSGLKEFNPDVIITLGGDGTILSAVTLIRELEIPILGINLGRLGFLASIEQERLDEAIDMFQEGKYTIVKRSMIALDAKPNIFDDNNFALNDFTLLKRDNSSMIVIHTYIDGKFLNSYWADGLIVATPTGSTGYSLSCGGPIIFPTSGNFAITPVAPHNLNVRPIVVPDDSEITFKIEGRSEHFLCTLDSRFETVTADHEITVKRSSLTTKLVFLPEIEFMKTIRQKLSWGFDKRNI